MLRLILITQVMLFWYEVNGMAPTVGGPGFAKYFSPAANGMPAVPGGPSSNTSIALAASETTVEFWARADDLYRHQALLSLVSDNGVAALVVVVGPTDVSLYHRSVAHDAQRFSCWASETTTAGPPSCSSLAFGSWTHIAVAINSAEGNLKLFINGTMRMDVLHDGATAQAGLYNLQLLRVPWPEGPTVLTLGGHVPSDMGITEALPASALIGQVRVWSEERSALKITEWMRRSVIPQAESQALHAVWHAAGQPTASPMLDPTDQLEAQQVDWSSEIDPTSKSLVVSTADLWDGPIGGVVGASENATVVLRASDVDGRPLSLSITRLPASGQLYECPPGAAYGRPCEAMAEEGIVLTSSVVLYVASDYSNFATDTFGYSATNDLLESSHAEVVLIRDDGSPLSAPVPETALDAQVGETLYLQVGGFGRAGEQVPVSVVSAPLHGRLYQVEYTTSMNTGKQAAVPSLGPQIDAATGPQAITARGSLVAFVPSASNADDAFSVSWGTDGQRTVQLAVSEAVGPTEPQPVTTQLVAEANEGSEAEVRLPIAGAAKFLQLPTHGRLSRSDGAELSLAEQPQVVQFGSFLPPYDPSWGPSWSAQWSPCPCCFSQASCNFAGGAADESQCPCTASRHSAVQALGAPDAPPQPGTAAPFGWSPQAEGKHFIVMGLTTPVHITDIKLYEAAAPGRVTRISASSSYAGNLTDWTVLYTGDVSRQHHSPQIFNPALCSAGTERFSFVRIDVTAESATDGGYLLDAMEVTGTQQPRANVLLPDNVVRFDPPEGMHGDVGLVQYDTIACDGSASGGVPNDLRLTVSPPMGTNTSTTMGAVIELSAVLGEETVLKVDTDRLQQLLPSHLKGQHCHVFQLLPQGSTDFTAPSGYGDDDVLVPQPEPTCDGSFSVHNSGSSYLATRPVQLQAWVQFGSGSAGSVTFRLAVTVHWKCPATASAVDCAMSPEPCLALGPGFDWDPSEMRCHSTGSNATVMVAMMSLLAVVLATVIAAILLCLRRRQVARVVPELEELKIDSDEESFLYSLQTDSPLCQVTYFLLELSQASNPWKGPLALFSPAKPGTHPLAGEAKELLQALCDSENIYLPLKISGQPRQDSHVDATEGTNFLMELLGQKEVDEEAYVALANSSVSTFAAQRRSVDIRRKSTGAGGRPPTSGVPFLAKQVSGKAGAVELDSVPPSKAQAASGVLGFLDFALAPTSRKEHGNIRNSNESIESLQGGASQGAGLGRPSSLGRRSTEASRESHHGALLAQRKEQTQSDAALVVAQVQDVCEKNEELDTLGKTLFFKTLSLTEEAKGMRLTAVCYKALLVLNVDSLLTSDEMTKFILFTQAIERRYVEVDYHCALHATDVTARMTGIMVSSGIAAASADDPSCKLMMLTTVVAAMVHDVGHPGTSNAFHSNTQSVLAKRFNDQSILEMNSLAIAFELLDRSAFNFTESWTFARRLEMRRSMISLVLATDFAYHFDHIGSFNSKILCKTVRDREQFHKLTHAERILVLMVGLKVADIGHCAADWASHRKWMDRLENEFFGQGDMEKKLKMPVSPLMDRDKVGAACAESQKSFFEGLAMPLFKAFATAYPGVSDLLDQAQSNLITWAPSAALKPSSGSRAMLTRFDVSPRPTASNPVSPTIEAVANFFKTAATARGAASMKRQPRRHSFMAPDEHNG